MTQSELKELKKTLRTQFQFRKLRPGQEEVIESILAGENTMAILPTGGGKSLCYQLPALHLKGVTVVISPLISLMKDQKEKLIEFGLEGLEFNSTLTQKEEDENLERLKEIDSHFIYATPERLENPEFLAGLQKAKIDFVVIDEAHCVSQWGHDFRPAYLNISHALKELGNPPVLALTATATREVVEDIKEQLKLKELNVFRTSLVRENLQLEAHHVDNEEEKRLALIQYLKELQGSGIIYASTVKAVDELYDFLLNQGFPVLKYHGKLKKSEREDNQNKFMGEDGQIMIATNAFGMGIDKSDIRFVIHNNFPGSLESYYQEAGRAGRDGKDSKCILLYLKKDKATQSLFLARKYPSFDELSKVYAFLVAMGGEKKEVARKQVEDALESFPKRKLSLLIAYLKNLEVLTEKKRGVLKIPRADLNSVQLSHLAQEYRERMDRDQDKLKQVIIYAQSALCRWKIITDYFEEEVEWNQCGHCDNCQRSVLKDAEKRMDEVNEEIEEAKSEL